MNFLLEIGTEEIPHWMIPGALEQLAAMNLFGAAVAGGCDSAAAGGARERVAGADAGRGTDRQRAADLGRATRPRRGFAKKQGVELSAMTKAGDYYELRKLVPGRAVRDILGRDAAGCDPRHPVAQDHVLDGRQDRAALHSADPLDRGAAGR